MKYTPERAAASRILVCLAAWTLATPVTGGNGTCPATVTPEEAAEFCLGAGRMEARSCRAPFCRRLCVYPGGRCIGLVRCYNQFLATCGRKLKPLTPTYDGEGVPNIYLATNTDLTRAMPKSYLSSQILGKFTSLYTELHDPLHAITESDPSETPQQKAEKARGMINSIIEGFSMFSDYIKHHPRDDNYDIHALTDMAIMLAGEFERYSDLSPNSLELTRHTTGRVGPSTPSPSSTSTAESWETSSETFGTAARQQHLSGREECPRQAIDCGNGELYAWATCILLSVMTFGVAVPTTWRVAFSRGFKSAKRLETPRARFQGSRESGQDGTASTQHPKTPHPYAVPNPSHGGLVHIPPPVIPPLDASNDHPSVAEGRSQDLRSRRRDEGAEGVSVVAEIHHHPIAPADSDDGDRDTDRGGSARRSESSPPSRSPPSQERARNRQSRRTQHPKPQQQRRDSSCPAPIDTTLRRRPPPQETPPPKPPRSTPPPEVPTSVRPKTKKS